MGYEIIKKLAKEKGVSLEEIATNAQISYNSLSKIIRNTIEEPKFTTMKSIANTLGMTTDQLAWAVGLSKENEKATPEQIRGGVNDLLDRHGLLLESDSREISQKQRELIIKMIDVILESDI